MALRFWLLYWTIRSCGHLSTRVLHWWLVVLVKAGVVLAWKVLTRKVLEWRLLLTVLLSPLLYLLPSVIIDALSELADLLLGLLLLFIVFLPLPVIVPLFEIVADDLVGVGVLVYFILFCFFLGDALATAAATANEQVENYGQAQEDEVLKAKDNHQVAQSVDLLAGKVVAVGAARFGQAK